MTDLKPKIIDMSEVVYSCDPQNILEVRSAMNKVIDSQSQMILWLTKFVSIEELSEEDRKAYHDLAGLTYNSLKGLMEALEHEDKVVGKDTKHLR